GVHRTDRDFALAWTKSFGEGRVFYTALGHRPEVWGDERFRKHVLGGLRWAMRAPIGVALKPADEEYRKFALENPGDPARGHALFRRESGPMCARCHTVNGTGGVIGPDLSGTAKAHSREEILEAILAPSASIEPGYEAISLELADETVAFGRVVKQSAEEIALADTTGQLRVIAPKNVVRRTASSVSVMPDGLASTLSKPEFADLLAYVMTLTVPPAR
ncbi:MAG: ThuA domain-containing protein, partial [Candidatus Eiseniibacteriota bacterium]